MTATIGELCMGYGGLGMGLSLALGGDTRVAWGVEFDKHPSAIIAHRYPGVPNYGDVNLTDWTKLEPVDWLTAGYPCQPFSLAGLRKGVDDPRHLWPGVARAISVLRPRNVLLENVAAHLRVGFDTVLADLARMGYDASWGVVRASDAGAPHGRARLFVVARNTSGGGRDATQPTHGRRGSSRPTRGSGFHVADPYGLGREGPRPAGPTPAVGRRPRYADRPADANTDRDGLELIGRELAVRRDAHGCSGADTVWGAYEPAVRRWEQILGRPASRPTEPGRTGERLSPRFVEWMMGLPDGWVTDVPDLPRNAQLKALGNGVVPQQAALACRLLGVTAEQAAA